MLEWNADSVLIRHSVSKSFKLSYQSLLDFYYCKIDDLFAIAVTPTAPLSEDTSYWTKLHVEHQNFERDGTISLAPTRLSSQENKQTPNQIFWLNYLLLPFGINTYQMKNEKSGEMEEENEEEEEGGREAVTEWDKMWNRKRGGGGWINRRGRKKSRSK